jgi:hypothetical protein
MDSNYNAPTQYSNNFNAPLIPNSHPSVVIVNNQVNPTPQELDNLQMALKSTPQFVSCPYCRYQGMTQTERKCSCCNLLCCIFCAAIPWLICQACRGKDINCYDADHYCTRCHNKLSTYRAC